MGAPSLPMGIYGFLADDLPSASANVHMSDSTQNTLKSSVNRNQETLKLHLSATCCDACGDIPRAYTP